MTADKIKQTGFDKYIDNLIENMSPKDAKFVEEHYTEFRDWIWEKEGEYPLASFYGYVKKKK